MFAEPRPSSLSDFLDRSPKFSAAAFKTWTDNFVGDVKTLVGKEDLGDAAAWRARMRSTNPRVVLRNWVAQEAIDAVEAGDMEVLERVLHAITHPYDESADEALGMRGPVTEDERYALPSGAVEGRCLS